jgi:membrane protease YdiL (CAAX protease family)
MTATEGFQPDSIPWTIRDTWLGVAALGPWLVFSVVISLLLATLDLEVNPGVLVGLAELFLLIPVWWFAVRKYRAGWDSVGLRSFQGQALGQGCGLMILSAIFNMIYATFLAWFDLDVQADLVPLFDELSSPLWMLLAGVIVAPVVEEVFFRGFVFAGLRKRYDWRKAATISSALFAVVHFQLTAFLPIFFLGYIFAFLYHRSNSIWPAILMHISTNALAMGTAYLLANTDLPT